MSPSAKKCRHCANAYKDRPCKHWEGPRETRDEDWRREWTMKTMLNCPSYEAVIPRPRRVS